MVSLAERKTRKWLSCLHKEAQHFIWVGKKVKRHNQHIIIIGTLSLEQMDGLVFPVEVLVGSQTYQIRKTRHLNHRGKPCAGCGIVGNIYKVIRSERDAPFTATLLLAHMRSDGTYVVMTTDHIIARADGGNSAASNKTTMCSDCNTKKGSIKALRYNTAANLFRLLKQKQERALAVINRESDKFDELVSIIRQYDNALIAYVDRYKKGHQ